MSRYVAVTGAPEAVANWVEVNRAAIVESNFDTLAKQAISRLESDSELATLWRDSDEYEEWRASLASIVSSNGGAPRRRVARERRSKPPVQLEPGDIVAVDRGEGILYFQLIVRHPRYGHFVRILPAVFSEMPDDLEERFRVRELPRLFCLLEVDLRTDAAEVVGRSPLPKQDPLFPPYATKVANPETGQIESAVRDLNLGKVRPIREGENPKRLVVYASTNIIADIKNGADLSSL
jgi:hypothetical protein